jgi:probable rRNA maturation factor
MKRRGPGVSAEGAPAPVSVRRRPLEATRPTLQLSLQFACDTTARAHRVQLPRHRVTRWIREALDRPASMTVRIVGLDEGRALNSDYRGRDSATNVLTFDYARTPTIEADLVLCAPVVEEEARAAGRPLVAHYAHLLVHGTLHAVGHDHGNDAEAEVMEGLETLILARLGFDDPYAT